MVDVAQFETIFRRWRPGKELSEGYALQTAILIGNYVTGKNLYDLDLVEDSEPFELFNTFAQANPEDDAAQALVTREPRARLYGTAAFLVFVIEESLQDQTLTTPERDKLHQLQNTIKSLYERPISFFPSTKTKITNIQVFLLSWLNENALTSVNPVQAKELCTFIYATLMIIYLHGSERMSDPQKLEFYALIQNARDKALELETRLQPAPAPPIDINPLEMELEGDNESEEGSDEDYLDFDELPAPQQQIAATPSEDEFFDFETRSEEDDDDDNIRFETPLAPPPVTFHSFFDEQFLNILTRRDVSLPDKITQIKDFLDQVHARLGLLIIKKQNELVLGKQIQHAQIIFEAVTHNEQLSTRLDARVLIKAHQTSLNSLLAVASEEEQTEWAHIHAAIQPSQSYTQTKEKLRGWSNSATTLFRKFTPGGVLTRVERMLPETPDSTCKNALKNLAQNRIIILRGHFNAAENRFENGLLDILEIEINDCITQLVEGNNEARELFKSAFISDLERLQVENRIAFQVLTAFESLVTRITSNQEKLRGCLGVNLAIDAFILEHDNFFVSLSLFLSHYISTFFKTDTADKIDQASKMKEQVAQWERDYQVEFDKDIETIRNNPHISDQIKEDLVTRLLSQPLPPEPELAPPETFIAKFALVDTLFKRAQPPLPPQPPPAVQAVVM